MLITNGHRYIEYRSEALCSWGTMHLVVRVHGSLHVCLNHVTSDFSIQKFFSISIVFFACNISTSLVWAFYQTEMCDDSCLL